LEITTTKSQEELEISRETLAPEEEIVIAQRKIRLQ
jgi:hypothetical protein